MKTQARVVAKVEWHPGELYPRVGLDSPRGSSVTNLSRPAERVVAFYNRREPDARRLPNDRFRAPECTLTARRRNPMTVARLCP